MKKYYMVLALMLFSVDAFAQGQGEENPYEYADRSEEMQDVEVPGYFTKHWLGAEFTTFTFALRQEFVYMPKKTPINKEPSLVTEKPVIYNAVKKMDRFYKKEIKKGRMQKAAAIENLKKIYGIAYSLRYAETEDLEKILWKTKKEADLEKLLLETIEMY
jgi:hypothetical protein